MKLAGSKYQDKILPLGFSIALLTFSFLYFLLRINPQLIYQAQQPVFFFDKHYVYEFFKYPGGAIELLSGFLSQFFYYSWAGAVLLAVVFGLTAWNTKLLIRVIDKERPVIYLHWIPLIFLLFLHSNYRFPLIPTLGLLLSLAAANISLRLRPKNNSLRLSFYIIIHTITYYLAGGQVFVFSAVIVFYETLYHRQIIQPILYIIFSGLLPFIGASYCFLMNIRDAYSIHLISSAKYNVTWISYVLYVFFPFTLLLFKFQMKYSKRRKNKSKKQTDKSLFYSSIAMRLAQGVIFLVLVGVSCFYSFNKNARACYMVDYYARFNKWDKILDMTQKGLPLTNVVLCQINRAFYHTGCLPDRMFSMAQLFEADSLFVHESLRTTFSLQHSDVFFDLGLINISEQWANEAISANGDTAWNLQRLALINLLKGKNEIAAKYLNMLRKTFWHRSWAREHEKHLSDNSKLWANPYYSHIKNIMPKTDFLISPTEPQLALEELFNSTKSKVAFEYLMAYYLLDGKISQFMKHVHQMNLFDYPNIPRHYEEAILIFSQLTDGKGITLPGKSISAETVLKYRDFYRIREKYKGNINAARIDLEKYRGTYWYYGLYYFEQGGK